VLDSFARWSGLRAPLSSYGASGGSLVGIRVSMSHLLLRKWRGEVLEKDAAPNQIRKAIGTSTNRLLTVCYYLLTLS
jgi:hypothetical protein